VHKFDFRHLISEKPNKWRPVERMSCSDSDSRFWQDLRGICFLLTVFASVKGLCPRYSCQLHSLQWGTLVQAHPVASIASTADYCCGYPIKSWNSCDTELLHSGSEHKAGLATMNTVNILVIWPMGSVARIIRRRMHSSVYHSPKQLLPPCQ